MVEREFGPFKIERLIAMGGMAEVYLAKTTGVSGFEKRLALKVIRSHYAEDEHFIRMLVEEAKIAVQLSHSNIVHVFDLGCSEGAYYLTMEYVDGPDLFRILKNAAARKLDLPFEMAAYVASQVCAGLEHAHGKCDADGTPLGIVHRDISPQNVLVSKSGEVKLVDFGIAKAALRAAQTRAGVIKGKYYYMSPEQAWGDQVDPRTDIFSCGVLLYEMLAGGMMYGEEPVEKLVGMVRRAEIAPITLRRPDVPTELAVIVMKALARDRAERFQSARAFESALNKFLVGYAPDFGAQRLSQLVRGIVPEDGGAIHEPPRRVSPARPAEAVALAGDIPNLIADTPNSRVRAGAVSSQGLSSYERSEDDDLADSLGRPAPPRSAMPTRPARAGASPNVNDANANAPFLSSLGLQPRGDGNPAATTERGAGFGTTTTFDSSAHGAAAAGAGISALLRAAIAVVALGLVAVITWYVISPH